MKSHHELGRRFLARGQDVDAVVRESSADAGAFTAAVHPVVPQRVLLQFVHQLHDVAVTQTKRLRRRLGVICDTHSITITSVIVAALYNRGGHYIFAL